MRHTIAFEADRAGVAASGIRQGNRRCAKRYGYPAFEG